MDKKVQDLLNRQINRELYSAYLYVDFANYYADEGLNGFASYYMVQAAEERDHALIMRNYLIANNCKVELAAIAQPDKKLASFMDPLTFAYEHELTVTASINEIYAAAHEVRDFRTMQFLDWFVAEQGEEEEAANDMITKMKLFGADSKALYELDQEYGARTYVMPAPLANASGA
ncbi:MAG: ferritin [Coriobacteriia bacterium]|jgi:ferritin|nr:ferritin [Coriobacteriia bacterium]MDR2715095.1 ferritin [Coriobacteriales bacterium]